MSREAFKEREKLNNEVIKEGVERWSKKILQKNEIDPDELGSGVHIRGELDEEHVAVENNLTISDAEFKKLMKAGRITVEGALLRWLKTNSSGLIVAKSLAEKKFMKSEGKEYVFIKVEVER